MLKLLFCVVGIYGCFLTWAVLQERVTTTDYNGSKFKFPIFLNTCQSIIASIVAFIYLKLFSISFGNISTELLKNYVKVAAINSIASPFGYASLKYIGYHTMTLGKSCKLVPVVVMNYLLYRKVYPPYTYVTVALITAGVSGFMFFGPSKGSSQGESWFGLLLVLINLTIDGITNASQDFIFRSFKTTGQQLMFFMNVVSSVLTLLWLFNPYNSELLSAITFCQTHHAVVWDILLFALCGSLGQCFIFYTIQHFGSFVLVSVTVTRKLFTMLLSVFWFNHTMTLAQWISVGVVFSGVVLESAMKQTSKKKKE